MPAGGALNILHVLRAPVGGLFRHVCDLARGQAARGHRVGVIADSSSGGAAAEAAFAGLSQSLALGLSRVPMTRQLGFADIAAIRHVSRRAAEVEAHVLHGHGAKGGAYVRLARTRNAIRVYTPHGGSLHYRWATPAGLLYLTAEAVLKPRTDLFLFESRYGRDTFAAKVGEPPSAKVRVVNNGVSAREFEPVTPAAGAGDLVFVGELRRLKGVDVLIDAVAGLARAGRHVSVCVVGDGPDRGTLEKAAGGLAVRFLGAMRARDAFALGRVLVVPSRAESLPYVVLEAAAARVPLIASNVGGIPEIFGPDAAALVPPADPGALARAIASALDQPDSLRAQTERLAVRVRDLFSVDTMTEAVLAGYRAALQPHG